MLDRTEKGGSINAQRSMPVYRSDVWNCSASATTLRNSVAAVQKTKCTPSERLPLYHSSMLTSTLVSKYVDSHPLAVRRCRMVLILRE